MVDGAQLVGLVEGMMKLLGETRSRCEHCLRFQRLLPVAASLLVSQQQNAELATQVRNLTISFDQVSNEVASLNFICDASQEDSVLAPACSTARSSSCCPEKARVRSTNAI